MKITATELFDTITMSLSENDTATFRIKGDSMLPFLSEHDKVTVTRKDRYRRDDIVLARDNEHGTVVLHAIMRELGNDMWELMGTANLCRRETCRTADIACAVVSVRRRTGKKISVDGPKWRTGMRLWRLMLPVRRYLMYIFRHCA